MSKNNPSASPIAQGSRLPEIAQTLFHHIGEEPTIRDIEFFSLCGIICEF